MLAGMPGQPSSTRPRAARPTGSGASAGSREVAETRGSVQGGAAWRRCCASGCTEVCPRVCRCARYVYRAGFVPCAEPLPKPHRGMRTVDRSAPARSGPLCGARLVCMRTCGVHCACGQLSASCTPMRRGTGTGRLLRGRRQHREHDSVGSQARGANGKGGAGSRAHHDVSLLAFTLLFTAELRLETRVSWTSGHSLSRHALCSTTRTQPNTRRCPGARTAPEMPRTRDLRDPASANPVDSLGMLSSHSGLTLENGPCLFVCRRAHCLTPAF